MAFGLSEFKAYPIEAQGATKFRDLQLLEFTITRGASGDTAFDFGTLTGNFWTAVGGSGLGLQAKEAFSKIAGNFRTLVSVFAIANSGVIREGASATATVYVFSNAGTYPVLTPAVTFASNAAPATVRITFVFELSEEKYPITFV